MATAMLPRGHADLIHGGTARRLLATRELARLAHTASMPPEVLLLRGRAEVTDADRPGVRMARIAVRPTWVGVLDFTTRFPGGGTADDFAQRGRA
jgi:hypothetical protein